MVDRIYTQEDYDKITSLYNEYKDTKDKYSPEQQQKIEEAFTNARIETSNKIEDWKNKFIDMRGDEEGNTWGKYGDGRVVLLQAAPQKRRRAPQAPEINYQGDTYWSPSNTNGDLSGARNSLVGPGSVAPDVDPKKNKFY